MRVHRTKANIGQIEPTSTVQWVCCRSVLFSEQLQLLRRTLLVGGSGPLLIGCETFEQVAAVFGLVLSHEVMGMERKGKHLKKGNWTSTKGNFVTKLPYFRFRRCHSFSKGKRFVVYFTSQLSIAGI